MQSLANYRQTALEQIQNLAAIANTDVATTPPSTEEVWGLRLLLATLVLLTWWSLLEDNNEWQLRKLAKILQERARV